MDAMTARVWDAAVPYLDVRDNDVHTLYAHSLATTLLAEHPEADARVVETAILLHDIGWSRVPPAEVLSAIAPGGGRPDLVLLHEREGAAMARAVLESLEAPPELVERVVQIIDGHDSRTEALSLEDALVKDADKLWRLTPHGVRTVQGWFGLPADETLALIEGRVHEHLFTDAGRRIARALAALARVDVSDRLAALAG